MNNQFKKSCWYKKPKGYEQITKGRRKWADNYKGKNYEMKSLEETIAECVCVCVCVCACARARKRTRPSLSCVQLFANSMDCSPPGSSVHGIFPGKNICVGFYFLLQETFLTQGSNPPFQHRLHWQADSLLLSHLRSPFHWYLTFNLSTP